MMKPLRTVFAAVALAAAVSATGTALPHSGANAAGAVATSAAAADY